MRGICIVEHKNGEDTAEAGNVEVAEVDVCQNTSDQAEPTADKEESKDNVNEGKTVEKQTTDAPDRTLEGTVTRKEEEFISESFEKQVDVQAKMLERTSMKKNDINAPKPSVV